MDDNNISAIYKIFCKDNNIIDIYIGKIRNFKKRKHAHKNCSYNLNNNLQLYTYIREHGGWNNWNMEIIEEYININDIDLHNRERYWIIELAPVLNSNRPIDIYNNTNTKYECYNCGYHRDNKTMMVRHLSNIRKCKSIRNIEIDLNKCKESILNRVSYIDYIKIIEDNNNTNNIILELKNEINKYKSEIQELIKESVNNKIEWINDKEKLVNKIQELIQESVNNKIEWINDKEKLVNKIKL